MLRKAKGFTLVELMVVGAIIGILAAITIPNFMEYREKARLKALKNQPAIEQPIEQPMEKSEGVPTLKIK